MRVAGTSSASSRLNGLVSQWPDEAGGGKPVAGRALVALSPARAADSLPAPIRRSAPFLAHLIAARDLHAQTRERRRAEPDVAVAAYHMTMQLDEQSVAARSIRRGRLSPE